MLRFDKAREYGEDRYKEENWDHALTMCYSDVYRKFIRLRTQLDNNDVDGMRETLRDLANYAIMGVQEIDRLMKEEDDGPETH